MLLSSVVNVSTRLVWLGIFQGNPDMERFELIIIKNVVTQIIKDFLKNCNESYTFLYGSIFEGIFLTYVIRSEEINFECNDVVSEHLVHFDSISHDWMGEEENPLDSCVSSTSLSSEEIITVVHCQFL